MNSSSNAQTGESTAGNVESTRCEQRYKIFSDYKEAFGGNFDTMKFLNYKTGEIDIPGAALREAQTGCELYEIMGWDSAEHNSAGVHKCRCKQFDEQLQFVSEDGEPLALTDYRIMLDDGKTVSGTTDNYGNTKRIKNTGKEKKITEVEFIASKRIQPLCPNNSIKPGAPTKRTSITGVYTTPTNIGSSVKTITVKGKYRKLTSGEISMLSQIFKNAIDYSKVKIHHNVWLPFQDKQTGVTPNGELYAPEKTFEEDYSSNLVKTDDKIWFMHEMVHVWQWQLGYWVKSNGLIYQTIAQLSGAGFRWVYSYDTNEKHKKLADYNMEQQAEIISHYYAATSLNAKKYMLYIDFYKMTLAVFMNQPSNKSLLPRAR